MRRRVFARLMDLSIDYFDRYNVGQLISRVQGDTEQMKGFIQQLTTGFFQQIIMVIAVGTMLFTMDWSLALWTLLPTPLVAGSAVFFWRRVYPRYYKVWDSNSKLAGVLNTILSGMRVVKAFAQEPREINRFDRSNSYVRNSFRSVEYTVAKFNPMMGFIFQLGGLIVWFTGGTKVIHHEITLGQQIAFIGYLWMFYQPLTQLTQLTNWLTGFLTATHRTFEILDTPIQIAEADKPVRVPDMNGPYRLRQGYFRLRPAPADPQERLVRDQARRTHRRGRQERFGQDHHHQPAQPLLRHRTGSHFHRRRRYPRDEQERPARPDRRGIAGAVPVPRNDLRQPDLRLAGDDPRGRHRRHQGRQRP